MDEDISIGKLLTAVIILSAIFGFGGAWSYDNFIKSDTNEDLIALFYATETATLVSPHHLREMMDSEDNSYILVDVRTEYEFNQEHIRGAINIDANLPKEKILEEFQNLQVMNKDIIIYCYSAPCMTGKKVGDFLAKNNVYVKELGVGWNEWRYDFNSFNFPSEWDNLNENDYIVVNNVEETIDETTDINPSTTCAIDGELSC